jgi:hypothetical protein
MKKRTMVASALALMGIVSGVVASVDNGLWLIMQAKGGPCLLMPLILLINLFSMFGRALSYQTTGEFASPLPFWTGQLLFYGGLFWAIHRIRPHKTKAEAPDATSGPPKES